MQETYPDDQAEPIIQTVQQEQSHEVLKLQRMKHILNKKNSLYKFHMLCPILLLLKEGEEEEVEVENLVEVLHQEEVRVEDMQGDPQGYKLIYLLVSMFLILSGMIPKVMEIIDLSTYLS